jgi:hypothetical protein
MREDAISRNSPNFQSYARWREDTRIIKKYQLAKRNCTIVLNICSLFEKNNVIIKDFVKKNVPIKILCSFFVSSKHAQFSLLDFPALRTVRNLYKLQSFLCNIVYSFYVQIFFCVFCFQTVIIFDEFFLPVDNYVCSLVEINWRFSAKFRLHLESWRLSKARNRP